MNRRGTACGGQQHERTASQQRTPQTSPPPPPPLPVGVVHEIGEGLALPGDLLTAVVRHSAGTFLCALFSLNRAAGGKRS
eukprot:364344-Chlamydomonas_euryale.AAC.26